MESGRARRNDAGKTNLWPVSPNKPKRRYRCHAAFRTIGELRFHWQSQLYQIPRPTESSRLSKADSSVCSSPWTMVSVQVPSAFLARRSTFRTILRDNQIFLQGWDSTIVFELLAAIIAFRRVGKDLGKQGRIKDRVWILLVHLQFAAENTGVRYYRAPCRCGCANRCHRPYRIGL